MMEKKIIENGGWEIRTTGKIEQSSVSFTVRCPIYERIGYKCKVDAEIVQKRNGIEINLVHKKILPSIVKDAIRTMAEEVLKESGVSMEPVLRLVTPLPQKKKPYRRWA